jgi:molybdopterin synthase catalytic subunit
MQVLAVTGPSDSGKTTTVATLAARLRERGSVATVKHLTHAPDVDTEGKDTARHRAAGAETTIGITDDEGWFATGADLTLSDALDGVAPAHDYALVEGFSGSALPKLALGGSDPAGPVLARAADHDAVDVASVIEALEAAEPFVTLPALVAEVKSAEGTDRAGAIATFTGRVRERDDPDDEPTAHPEFERYDAVATERLATIRSELEAREGVSAVRLHHRPGVVEAGGDVVFVVVLAGHRQAAFAAVSDGIDRLREEVPLFEKEVTVEESFWRHERPDG